MNDEKYADIFTKTVTTFHLIRHSFRVKRLRKRKFNSPDARSFVLDWDAQINKVKGYREIEEARERYIAENIMYLSKEHSRVLAVLELERLDGIYTKLKEMK
jgi:pheromone shutdown protein TraB